MNLKSTWANVNEEQLSSGESRFCPLVAAAHRFFAEFPLTLSFQETGRGEGVLQKACSPKMEHERER
jgi:hypothetical protein